MTTRRRVTSSSDAGTWLQQHAGGTLTKAEHDRRVNETGRPITDDGIRPRHHRRGPAALPDDDANYHGVTVTPPTP